MINLKITRATFETNERRWTDTLSTANQFNVWMALWAKVGRAQLPLTRALGRAAIPQFARWQQHRSLPAGHRGRRLYRPRKKVFFRLTDLYKQWLQVICDDDTCDCNDQNQSPKPLVSHIILKNGHISFTKLSANGDMSGLMIS